MGKNVTEGVVRKGVQETIPVVPTHIHCNYFNDTISIQERQIRVERLLEGVCSCPIDWIFDHVPHVDVCCSMAHKVLWSIVFHTLVRRARIPWRKEDHIRALLLSHHVRPFSILHVQYSDKGF